VTLAGAFVPLVAGLFWKRATAGGAMASILLGLATWLLAEAFAPDGPWPTQFVGLAFAILGMVLGSLASKPALPHPA
jgi:Na+/proline symporter